MGRDKAFVEVDGEIMVRRVAMSLTAAGCAPVFAIGGDVDRLTDVGLTVVADRFPGEGPLGGILSALAASGVPTLIVATDLPRLDPAAVALLLAHAGREDLDVAIARSERLEPLCALWWPSAAAALDRCFGSGERAVHRALQGLRREEVAVPAAALTNVNSPADLGRRA
jgi:molybdopterin-guanine dinucleotide biosynthesis protein A